MVGAAAIAIAPIQPSMPDVQVPSLHSASVELAAFANPIEAWLEVLGTGAANVGALGQQVLADPAPVLQQLITNQFANAAVLGDAGQQAVTALVALVQGLPAAVEAAVATGNIVDAVNSLVLYVISSGLGLVGSLVEGYTVVTNTLQNVQNVAGVIVPDVVLALGLGVIAPIVSTLTAGATTAQEVVDGVGGGDPVTALSAIINAPATLTGAFLNGYPGSFLPAGVLSPWTGGAFDSGPIAIALALRDEIAGALHPLPPPVSITSLNAEQSKVESTLTDTTRDNATTTTDTDTTTTTTTDTGTDVSEVGDGANEKVTLAVVKPSVKEKTAFKPGNLFAPITKAGANAGTSTTRPTPLRDIGEGISKTVNDISHGIKKALGIDKKVDKKKAASSTDSSKSGDSGAGGGSSSAGGEG
ncbi:MULTISPECIES: hypothetical protein [unclassified Mycobacterium]|uniref:hypothetical protein n=1 Tax=unclassified Mycobacterium TaxID=2642494 RepID=UPI0029C890DA|nr:MULTISPECIES: hypothetical protein [unclassified Mycobacterium]